MSTAGPLPGSTAPSNAHRALRLARAAPNLHARHQTVREARCGIGAAGAGCGGAPKQQQQQRCRRCSRPQGAEGRPEPPRRPVAVHIVCTDCAKHTRKAQHARTGSGRRVQGLRLARRRLAFVSMRQRGAWRGPPIRIELQRCRQQHAPSAQSHLLRALPLQ